MRNKSSSAAAVLAALLLLTLVTASGMPVSARRAALGQPAGVGNPDSLPVGQDAQLPLGSLDRGLPPGPAQVFIPAAFHGFRTCTPDSPFSIQIAALHQITPGAASKAEWMAWYEAVLPSLVQALKESGACWARVLIDWEVIEPEAPLPGQPPVYSWRYHDPKLALIGGTGVQMVGTVEMVPDWARTVDPELPDLRCTAIDPDRFGDFAQFLTDVVNRYKQPPYNIHVWELRNEPDGTWEDRALVGQGCAGFRGDLYAQMAQHAYAAIKAADPSATVLMGGVAYDWFTDSYPVDPNGPFYRYFSDEVAAAGAAPYLDAINLHYFEDFAGEWERWDPNSEDRRNGWLPAPTCGDLFDGAGTEYYAGGIDLIAKVSHFRNRLSTCFGVDKPVWVTELATPGIPGDATSMAQQARYVVQAYSRGLSVGVRSLNWFALVTPPGDPGTQGLVYFDETGQLIAKPSFDTYKTMVSQLAGWHYASTLAVEGVEGYLFQGTAGKTKTVAWANAGPLVAAYLAFPGAALLEVVDRTGSTSTVKDGGAGDADGARDGTVTIELPGAPVDPDPNSPPTRFTAEPYFISEP